MMDLDSKTPGWIVDRIYDLREKRRELEAKAAIIKADEDVLKEHLIKRLGKEELNALSGKHAKCSLNKTDVASAVDWDKVNAFIEEHDAWQIRNKALNQLALRELREAGVEVPGVTWFTQVKINVRKL